MFKTTIWWKYNMWLMTHFWQLYEFCYEVCLLKKLCSLFSLLSNNDVIEWLRELIWYGEP